MSDNIIVLPTKTFSKFKTYGRGYRFTEPPTKSILRSAKPIMCESIRRTQEQLHAPARNIRFELIGFDYFWKADFDVKEESWLGGKPVG